MVTKADIKYELEFLENMSATEIEKDYMDTINIWLSGSGGNTTTNGYFQYIIQYKNTKMYEKQMVAGATANQAFIHGAIHAVRRISKPGRICIIVPTALGFEKAFEGKGVNANLISSLYDEIVKKGCGLTEARFINGADIIKKYIAINSGKNDVVAEYNKKNTEKEDRKKQYKKMIYNECLNKVYRILIDEGIDEKIIDRIKQISCNLPEQEDEKHDNGVRYGEINETR